MTQNKSHYGLQPAKTGGYLSTHSKRQLAEMIVDLSEETKRLKQDLERYKAIYEGEKTNDDKNQTD